MGHRHEQLIAWQRADDLFIRVHQLAASRLPASERYELGSQLRRAAYSVPANIVEGFARRSFKERAHFLNIAEASLAEVGYCLHVARRLAYLGESEYAELEREVRATAAPLVGLLRAVRAEKVPVA
jgi:four helix bundle protein